MQKRSHPSEEAPASTRRRFLQQAAGASLATVAGVALIPGTSTAQQPPFDYIQVTDELMAAGAAGAADMDIMNFALTLERLEATFYNLNANKAYLTDPTPGTMLTALPVGSEVVPNAVNTSGVALARFTLSPDRTQVFYEIRTTGLSGDVTAIRLQRGPRGQMGDIAYTLMPAVNGVSMGSIAVDPADAEVLLNQGLYLNILTAANPEGEIRGQVIAAPPGTVTSDAPILKNIVDEIRDHENAHVSLLEQALGENAEPAPQFQNLDAADLSQFLTMAQMFEDVGVSAYLGVLPQVQNASLRQTGEAILAIEGRHAGGLRAYRKVAAPAEGGDGNITLSEDREAVNRARTRAEVLAIIQPFLGASTVLPGTTPVTQPPPTPNGTTPGTGTTPATPGTTPLPTLPGTDTDGVGPAQQN